MDEFHKIYLETLKNDNLEFSGYLVSHRPTDERYFYMAISSQWVGNEDKNEIREASCVKYVNTKAHFSLLNYPLSVINNLTQLTIFLEIGGHAIIAKDIVESNLKEILTPQIVADTYSESYLSYETLTKKDKQRYARGNYRMEIFQRDNHKCKICGTCPDDNVHVKLEIHHIKPWEEGGFSTPENLITLCSTCHEGIKTVNRDILYNKIGLYFRFSKHKVFPYNENWTTEQHRSYDFLVRNCITLKISNTRKYKQKK